MPLSKSRIDLIAVVIVNWNSGDWLRRCLRGLAAQTILPERVLLVDNYSNDSSLDGIEAILPTVEIIRESENLGFAKGNNIALKSIEGTKWTVLLNPDAIPEPDWLENLIKASQAHPDYNFFACKMLDAADHARLDGTGDAYHSSGRAWRQGFGGDSQIEGELTKECFSPCAAAAMYRTDILRQVGGFDERFFCYYEDVDLGFRLRLLGHRCLYVPDAVVQHAGSATTSKRSDFSVYYGHRNMVWTYFKNMPWPLFWIYLPQHILMNVVAVLLLSLRGQGQVVFRAKYDAVKGFFPVLRHRKNVQETRKITSLELWRVMAKGIRPLLRKC